MNIGLCGSHRTGKTTLAEAISVAKDMIFVKTRTSAVFDEFNLHPAKPMDFATRLFIQHKVLDAGVTFWQGSKHSFISDRTPIDMMAYTLADIQGSTEVNIHDLEHYLNRCFELTNKYFTHLIVIQPGIPLIYEDGKAALNLAYIEHLNTLILGLCNDSRIKSDIFYLKRETINIEDRLNVILNYLPSTID